MNAGYVSPTFATLSYGMLDRSPMPMMLAVGVPVVVFAALLQIVENRCAPRRPTLIQRGVLGRPAAGWAPRRYQTA